jgi:archaeosine-15-forming tRNA-guanine transglycosylase
MTDPIDPIRFLDNTPARRLWLLAEALQSMPFDRALELARSAEAFLMESDKTTDTGTTRSGSKDEQPIASPPTNHEATRRGVPLSDDQRGRLLERLAEGARNAELAAAFGLSAKQVQGVRMGCAREIAERRARRIQQSPAPVDASQHDTALLTSIDEIVRYLRQQDDVVVPQEDGGYLVNGRFRMSAAELTQRANRMRRRQGRPAFASAFRSQTDVVPNRHPLFWKDSAAADAAPGGKMHRQTNIDSEGA